MDSTDKPDPAEQDDGTAETASSLEFNFVPDWAKQPPPAQVDFFVSKGRKERDIPDEGRDRKRPGHGRPAPARGGPRPDNNRRDDRRSAHPTRPPEPRREVPQRRPEPVERVPVQVRFMPEQKRLAAVAREIQVSKKSYPLVDLATLFLSRPETCEVRLELDREFRAQLHQCKFCRLVARDPALIATHIVKDHLADCFDQEAVLSDPPSGQFTCVAKCGLSGEILAPPNHHSYNDKILEIHQARYPDMPMESYRNRIQIVHDAAVIEQWKEASRKQTLYRRKPDGGEPGTPITLAEAEAVMLKEIVPTAIQQTRHAILPAVTAQAIRDPGLRLAVQEAWRKENRFPLTLLLALRGALHHRHLHFFKAGKGIEFVSSVIPTPLDPEQTVEPIRQVLNHLREHPGCTRKDLVAALLPDIAADAPEVRNVLTPLAWLVERGHIIEFFNGTLSTPVKRQPVQSKPPAGPVKG